MDAGLVWTAVGSATGVLAVGLTAWQVRLQLRERRESHRRHTGVRELPVPAVGGLPVTVPLGRLPGEVRGRDALLKELRRPLARLRRRSGRVWVLAGMGGVGKSTVALATAQAAQSRGCRVWWVTATDRAWLTGGMLEVLGQLGAPESVTRPVREGAPTAADRAWEFLNGAHGAGRRWLLIFDNADDPSALAAYGTTTPADLAGWLRPDPCGMVIVTTRNKDPRTWGPRFELRELTTLDAASSAKVLADLAAGIADPTGQQARDLAQRLGGLPLALHLAGSYLASPFARWHSFGDYRSALDSVELPAALADLDDPRGQTRATIQRTWDLSLNALAAEGRGPARRLLLLLSCYAPATPIPAELLQADPLAGLLQAGDSASVGSNSAGERQRLLRDSLQGLAAVGLIDITSTAGEAGAQTATLHPVVADANRSRMLTTAQADLVLIGPVAVRILQSAAGRLGTRRPADWPAWHRLVPHLAAVLGWLAARMDSDTLASLLNISDAAAEALRTSGNPAAAEKLARSGVAAARRLGDDHSACMSATQELAQAIGDQGRNSEAEQMNRQLLADQQRVLGDEHPATLATRHHLAWMIECQGRYGEAEQMYRQLITDQQRKLGDKHPDTLNTRNLLARVICLQGRYEEAEHLCREELADRQQILGIDHPATLITRHNLAWMIGLGGRYAEGEQLCREVLADRQRILGNDHPATLTTRLRLARLVSKQGRYPEAERLCREVLTDRQRILGHDHPVTLTARTVLARTIGLQGRYAESVQLCQQVLTAQGVSDEHPNTLVARHHLAWMTGRQGDYEEAERLLSQVLADSGS